MVYLWSADMNWVIVHSCHVHLKKKSRSQISKTCVVSSILEYISTSMIPSDGEIPLGERDIIRIVSHLRQIIGNSFGSLSHIVSLSRICKVFCQFCWFASLLEYHNKQGKKVCKTTAVWCYHFLLSREVKSKPITRRRSYSGQLLTAADRSKNIALCYNNT